MHDFGRFLRDICLVIISNDVPHVVRDSENPSAHRHPQFFGHLGILGKNDFSMINVGELFCNVPELELEIVTELHVKLVRTVLTVEQSHGKLDDIRMVSQQINRLLFFLIIRSRS